MIRRSLPLLALLVVASVARGAEPTTKPVRVFTAGHSFHMPIVDPLAEVSKAAGLDHRVAGRQSIGGSTVTQHWDLPDERNKAKPALAAGEVDVLTLSPHLLVPDPAIDKFTDLLLEHNPAARVTVQVSWIPRDARLLDKSFKQADRDTADLGEIRTATEVYASKMREQVAATNARYAERLKRPVVFVVPVGQAVTLLRERVAKGEVPGVAKQSDLFRDELGHGKEAVYLLNAYCHFAVIHGRTPVGLPMPAAFKRAGLGENAEKVNRLLQEIAWQAVTAEPMSGVKAEAK